MPATNPKPVPIRNILFALGAWFALAGAYHVWRPDADLKMTQLRMNTNLGILSVDHFRLDNSSYLDVKDPVITCEMDGASGTTIKKSSKTIYEVVPSSGSHEFGPVDMGEVPDQATQFKCFISSASVKW